MKKILFLLALAGILAPGLSNALTRADDVTSAMPVIQSTTQTQHKVHKKRHRVKRRTVKTKSARAQMQLRQGQKHQAEEQKVNKAQQKLKQDTTKLN